MSDKFGSDTDSQCTPATECTTTRTPTHNAQGGTAADSIAIYSYPEFPKGSFTMNPRSKKIESRMAHILREDGYVSCDERELNWLALPNLPAKSAEPGDLIYFPGYINKNEALKCTMVDKSCRFILLPDNKMIDGKIVEVPIICRVLLHSFKGKLLPSEPWPFDSYPPTKNSICSYLCQQCLAFPCQGTFNHLAVDINELDQGQLQRFTVLSETATSTPEPATPTRQEVAELMGKDQDANSKNTFCAALQNHCSRLHLNCLLYTSPSPRDGLLSRMPSSA